VLIPVRLVAADWLAEMADMFPARRAAAPGRKEVLSQPSTLGITSGGNVTEHRSGREKLRRLMSLARAQDLTPVIARRARSARPNQCAFLDGRPVPFRGITDDACFFPPFP